MQLITDEYKKLNEQLHEKSKLYGTSGVYYLDQVISILKELKTQDVLDYGCGKSTLAMNLPFTIKQYDPAVPRYKQLPRPADLVVCTDVLEHIEPEMLDNVLQHIASLIIKMGFLVVSTMEARKHLPDGRNAHLIIQPRKWWLEKMNQYFEIIQFTTTEGEGFRNVAFIVHPLTKGEVK
jgi:hypothetical protein